MKKAVNAWLFPSSMTYLECMEKAKKAGFEGIELNVGDEGELTLNSGEKEILALGKQAEDVGIKITSISTSLSWGAPITSNDETKRSKGIATIRKQLEAAALLKADTILVVPGVVDNGSNGGGEVRYDTAYDRAYEILRDLADEAEQYKVCIGLENVWNKFLLSPLEMKKMIDDIDSPYVGAYFDVGNVLINGYPEQWIGILGERIKKVHIKEYKLGTIPHEGFVGLLEGDVDFPRVMKALHDVGYDGYLIAEMFSSSEDVDAEVLRVAEGMEKIIKTGC